MILPILFQNKNLAWAVLTDEKETMDNRKLAKALGAKLSGYLDRKEALPAIDVSTINFYLQQQFTDD
jgi:hypothetical protein